MKSGTGDDPFADPAEETEETAEGETESEPGTEAEPENPPRNEEGTDQSDSSTASSQSEEVSEDSATTDADNAGRPDASHIPWVLRRSSVKDGRPNITQFFLRDETDRAERALRSDVEQILDKDVYTLDLREAAYLVAMEHPEEVAETLRDWGYDYLD